MKRSEVMFVIGSIIGKEYKNHHEPTYGDLKIADKVLETIEDIGMLPPYDVADEPWGFNEGLITPPIWDEEEN